MVDEPVQRPRPSPDTGRNVLGALLYVVVVGLLVASLRLAAPLRRPPLMTTQTFASVDLAGYSALTDAHSDEAAAQLAKRLCELAQELVVPLPRNRDILAE